MTDSTEEPANRSRTGGPEIGRDGPALALGLVVALTGGVTVVQYGLVEFTSPPAGSLSEIGWRLATVFVPFVVGLGGFFAVRGRPVEVSPPSVTDLGYVAGGVVVAYLTFGAYVVGTTTFAPSFAHFAGVDAGAVTPESVLVGVVSLVVFSGVTVAVEEWFFRGTVQTYLRSVVGSVGAVGVTALCFAWFHVWPLGIGTPPFVGGAVYYTAMGIVFGSVYEATDNVVVPFTVHALFNAGPYVAVLVTLS